MIVVCTGSRKFADPNAAIQAIYDRLFELPLGTVIYQGGAPGTDQWVQDACSDLSRFLDRDFVCRTRRARWLDHIGCSCRDKRAGSTCRFAGLRRNREMLDLDPNLVLAFWNGSSSGTRDCIGEARRRGIPVEVKTI